MDILRRDVFEVHAVDLGAELAVFSHPRRRHDVIERKRGVCLQLRIKIGSANKLTAGAFLCRSALTCFTRSMTSKSRARPEMP